MAKHATMSIDTLTGGKPNRIEIAVGKMEEALAALSPDKRANIEEVTTLSFDEFFAFQNAQARAHASGVLTLDEAQAIYMGLGGDCYEGNFPASTSLALRVVILQLMVKLLRSGK